jgi:hypothetical protein
LTSNNGTLPKGSRLVECVHGAAADLLQRGVRFRRIGG